MQLRHLLLVSLAGLAACGSSDDGRRRRGLDEVPPTPVLVKLDPDSGKAGDTVVIHGENLGETKAKVFFGKRAATVASWSATAVKVTVPSSAGNLVAVEIDGLRSNTLDFTLETSTPKTGGKTGTVPGTVTPGGGVPTGTLQGTIFAASGATAPAAHVVVAADAAFTRDVLYATAGIDAMYSVAVPEGNYYVKASRDANANGAYFEIGADEIGWAGRFGVGAGMVTVGDVNLDPAATSTVSGRVVDAGATWGTAVTGVVTWDTGARTIRYAAAMSRGDFTAPEVPGATVGVVAYRDLNGDGKFQANVEPAVTVSSGAVVPATGLGVTFPDKRTITGTIANAAGWTVVAQDRTNVDPSWNRWLVGTQTLGASGTFTITALASTYRLRVFRDLNGNGVQDGNEPGQTLTATFDATAGDPAPFSLTLLPDIRLVKTRVFNDASGNGYLSPGESGKLEITVENQRGDASNLAVVASAAANVTVNGNTPLPASLAYGQRASFTVDVTAATVAPGEQIEVVADITADFGYATARSAFAGIFAAAPYTLSNVALSFSDISGDPNAVVLWNAQNDQNTEFVDFRANQGYFTGTAFAFPIYGYWVTDPAAQAFGRGMNDGVEVGDNGYMDFLRAADLPPIPLPSTDRDTQLVLAPQWGNFIPGQVHALVAGTAPNRTLTIQWKDVSPETSPATDLSFQVVLHETTGVIDVVYAATTPVPYQAVGLNYGDGSTWLTWSPSTAAAVRLTPAW